MCSLRFMCEAQGPGARGRGPVLRGFLLSLLLIPLLAHAPIHPFAHSVFSL